jgi:hypothetical protein
MKTNVSDNGVKRRLKMESKDWEFGGGGGGAAVQWPAAHATTSHGTLSLRGALSP